MPLKIPRNLLLVSLVACLATGCIAYYAYTNIVSASRSELLISRSRQNLLLIEQMLNQTAGIEESSEKAIQTGDETFFSEYDSTRQMLKGEIAALEDFEKDNTSQQQYMLNLKSHLNSLFATIDTALDSKVSSSNNNLAYIQSGQGKATINEVKYILNRIKGHENSLLLLMEEESAASTGKSVYAIYAGAGLSVVFVISLLFLLNAGILKREKTENLALENEKKYRDMLRNIDDAVYTCDENGYFKMISPRVTDITGYKPEDLSGKHFSFIVAPEWAEDVSKFYLSQFNNETDETRKEFEVITTSGEKIWVEQKAVVLKEGERATGYQFTLRDITSDKNAESALALSNKKIRDLFKLSPFAVSMSELESGELLDINEEFTSIFGYSPEDIRGASPINIAMLTPEEKAEIKGDIEKYGYTKNREHRFHTKTGEVITCLFSTILIDTDTTPAVLTIYNTISELKKLENALEESHKKFLTVFNSSLQAVCVSEVTNHIKPGIITEVNNAFCELFKTMRTEIIGHTMPELKLISVGQLEKILTDFASKKYVANHEMNMFRSSGEKITCLVSFNEVESDGTIYRVWIFNNITERKKLENELLAAKERAEESTRAKESFVAHMSHEIRTPITGIMGLSDLLGETPLSSEQKEYLGGIMHSSESLLTIINEILDISKINAGKIVVEKVPFNLHTVIRNVIFTLEPRATLKGIQFKCKIDESVPENAIGDSVRLSQILWNLAGNAIKFTEKGFVEISVVKLSEENSKMRLLFTIIDTGIGIARHRLANIFEEFTQADSTITRKYGGTGLGLPIANKLVELHGGTISIESQEGMGSAFRFSLEYGKYKPQLLPDAGKLLENSQPKEEINLTGINILLAEDNVVNQGVCRKILTNKGAKIDIVENGKEVIKMLGSKSYDIILMDIQMPEMNGYEAAQFIRSKMSPPKSAIPIVALTAFAMEGENEKCFTAGMNDYISKPFKARELCEKVWQVTRQKQNISAN